MKPTQEKQSAKQAKAKDLNHALQDPSVELIAIGREVLDGRVLDTNSVTIAELLKPRGLVPRHGQRVDDDLARIVAAFEIAASRSQIVLVTGGLGPTSDDLTAQALAQFLKAPLEINSEAMEQLTETFQRIQRPMIEVQKKQALLPRGCMVLKNTKGTAPGFMVEAQGAFWFFMPGVPLEMKAMMAEQVIPHLPQRQSILSKTWLTQFTSEGKLQETLTNVEKKLPTGFEITYRTRFPENHIGLYGDGLTTERKQAFETLSAEITQLLGSDVFAQLGHEQPYVPLEAVVLNLCKEKNAVLCTVESCTGGLVAHRLTSVSGASDVFWGSMVTYENSAKELFTQVSSQTLEKFGAVSTEAASEMSLGGLERMQNAVQTHWSKFAKKAQHFICVSTTGIAGPTGGSKEKPVGLCFIGIASSSATNTLDAHVEKVLGPNWLDRERYKLLFSQKALEKIRQHLLQLP